MKQQEKQWISDDLEQVYDRINSVSSRYERTRLILMAYRLHKANRKTVQSSEIPESGISDGKKAPTMKAFMEEASQRTGFAKSTVYNRIKEGEALEKLDDRALTACLGTSLANKLSDLVRIAAIPKPEIQLDLVNLYDRQRPYAMAELEKWEAHFQVTKATAKKKKQAGREANPNEPKEDDPKGSNDTEKPTVDPSSSDVQDNSKLPIATMAKSGQLEGTLSNTKDGFAGCFEINGEAWKLVVARNCKTFVLVRQEVAPLPILRPLAKGMIENGLLTGKTIQAIIEEALGNAGPPKQQPNGIDVIFRHGGQKWTLSWWPTMPSSKKIELSHLSTNEAIATVRGPWTTDEFSRSFLRQFRAQRGAAS